MLAQRGDSIPSSKISLSALVSDVFKLLSLSLSLSLSLELRVASQVPKELKTEILVN